MEKEKHIQKAISQAAGNVQLEEMEVPDHDLQKIQDVLSRYYQEHSNEAVHSLFYDLVQALECEKKKNGDHNEKHK